MKPTGYLPCWLSMRFCFFCYTKDVGGGGLLHKERVLFARSACTQYFGLHWMPGFQQASGVECNRHLIFVTSDASDFKIQGFTLKHVQSGLIELSGVESHCREKIRRVLACGGVQRVRLITVHL